MNRETLERIIETLEAGGKPVFTATQDGRKLTITLTPTTIFALTIQ